MSMSFDGLSLYFTSYFRPDGLGWGDLYVATRTKLKGKSEGHKP